MRLAEGGSQTVFLPKADGDADYRVVLRGQANGTASLNVRKHLGLAELSVDTKEIRLESHQILTADISVSASGEGGASVSVGDISVPTAEDGTPLHYDMNGDGKMDEEDTEMVSSRWNACEGDPGYDPFFDLDDGCITVVDIMQVTNGR